MWMNTEDARTDVILAGAVAVFGIFVVGLLSALPFYPGGGITGPFLTVGWMFVLTGLTPHLLTRHRKLGPESYGLEGHSLSWRSGLLLASPIIAAGFLRGITELDASPLRALLGRFSSVLVGNPTIGADAGTLAGLDIVVQVFAFVAVGAGTLLLFTFLTVRGRDAFRQVDLSVTEALRTFGMGTVAATLLFGSMTALVSETITFVSVLINVGALVALVLLADRLVPHGQQTSRPAILTPLVLAVLLHVLGARGGNLLLGLYAASAAAATATVIASVIEGRTHARAVLPLVAAIAFYPSCLTPLALDLGLAC